MKYLKNIVVLAGAALLLPACINLDAYPDSGTVLGEQKDSSMLESDVNSFNSVFIYCGVDVTAQHNDFGYPGICMMYDAVSADVPCPETGYNWFRRVTEFSDKVYTDPTQRMAWSTYFKYIASANNIIATLKDAEADETGNMYLGYGYVARAFAYLNLVQMYAFNYSTIDPATTKAVPIVTEETSAEQITNNPRATVEEVYALILSDLDAAIAVLADAAERPNKSYADLSVAYGVRARANLAMHKYADAARDARAALDESSTTLLSRTAVSTPGFNSASIPSVMWASIVSPTSGAVTSGIVNWVSHMCTFDTSGYTAVGGVRQINQMLWDLIPASDVRKGWWVDADLNSPLIEGMTYEGVPVQDNPTLSFSPYVNVKFHDYENVLGGEQNASDWIMMRREEMVLIEAEGLAMSGNLAGGKAALDAWVQANRDPEFASSAATAEEFQDEIWFQRRIELWSEGFAFFDLMRLEKNIVRFAAGKPSTFLESQQFNVAADNTVLVWAFPDEEINGNKALSNTVDNYRNVVPRAGDGAGLTDGIVN
jgi:hypothetical protein